MDHIIRRASHSFQNVALDLTTYYSKISTFPTNIYITDNINNEKR